MTPDELAALRASLEPEWHDLRQRRVLEAALEARRRARTEPSDRRRDLRAPLAAVAVAALALGAILAWPEDPARTETVAAPLSHMRFADGSTAILSPGASVEIREQREEVVRVLQRGGRVRYRVVRDAARLFVVEAGGVHVTVVGTEFDVERIDDLVRVEVLRGRVRVSDGARELELSRGETLQITPAATPPVERASAPRAEPTPAPDAPGPDAPEPVEPATPPISIAALQSRADRARIAGRDDEAAALLERLIRLDPRDPRATTALFTLGSIHGAKGRHARAARYFARYRTRAPNGTLHEDALAAEAVHAAASGDAARGSRLAREYAERYPSGAHRAAMRRLMDP